MVDAGSGAFVRYGESGARFEDHRLIAITHMSNVLGTVTPIKEICRIAHERGIKVLPPGTGLAGRVLHARFLGDMALLEIGVAGFDAPLRVRVSQDTAIERGHDVGIEIDPSRILVFPGTQSDNETA